MEIAYFLVKNLLYILLNVYYSEIVIQGLQNIPKDLPLIFAGTHPNALIDPICCGRTIRFVAKDQLFRLPLLGFILRKLKAVPVFRPKDHGNSPTDNNAMFEKLFETLYNGDCVSIFPEGTTVFEPHILPLKTGTARIAYGFAAKYQKNVAIVPVGLNYMERNKFRSKVFVNFGAPIVIDYEHLKKYKEDDHKAVNELTAKELQSSLQSLTINAPDWVTLRVLETARNLYIPEDAELSPAQYVELTKRFIEGYQAASIQHKDELEPLKRRVENWQLKLDMLALTDDDVRRSTKAVRAQRNMETILINMLIWWPLALLGVALNSPIAIMSSLGGRFLARGEIVEAATYKIIAALISLLFFYTSVPLLIWKYFDGTLALFSIVLLPLSGWAAVKVRPIGTSTAFVSRMLKIVPNDLKKERQELKAEVLKAVDAFIDPKMDRLYYKKQANQ